MALDESSQRTERVAKAPSMSEEDYVEAGARELKQLYADMAPDMCRLLSQQRLVLVLDLDHTLVNSARQTEIDPEHVLVGSRPTHFLSSAALVTLWIEEEHAHAWAVAEAACCFLGFPPWRRLKH